MFKGRHRDDSILLLKRRRKQRTKQQKTGKHMNKFKSIAAVFAIVAALGATALVVGCKHGGGSDSHSSGHVHQYTCKHHPEVVQSTPGNCPKCGMKLTHKD